MISNKIINTSIKMGQILEFNIAFPDEKPLTPEEYLKGGNKDFILNVATYFLGFKVHNSKYNDNRELFKTIFGQKNNKLANEVYNRIKTIEKTGKKLLIVNAYSSLKLFEYFFQREEEEITQTNEEFEVNFFKAYLVFNSEFTKKQEVAFTSIEKLDSELQVPMMAFCMQYPIFDKVDYNITQIWSTQIIKAIYLFQFLETNNKTKQLLNEFLAYFKNSTWQEYLKSLMPLTITSVKNEKEAHIDITITQGERFKEGCDFLERLIINENDELEENDFITLRARPFYKIKEGVYRVIFNLFVVEKIFKGVYFLLRDIINECI